MSGVSGETMRLVLVTGLSGAGKTSALGALADCGFETVDNPPIKLLDAIMDDFAASSHRDVRVAIGVDERTNGFTTERLANTISALRQRQDVTLTLLYLDCSNETLLRRFTETRRRHPMAGGETVEAALALERSVIVPLKEQADITVDTSDLSLTELRREMQERFSEEPGDSLSISVVSFGFKRGAPREADILFDVRFLTNPYWNPDLRSSTGLDAEVDIFVSKSEGFTEVFNSLCTLVGQVTPLYAKEGKSYLTIAIGCTGGKHRSVAVSERLGAFLRGLGYKPAVRHRDLRKALSTISKPAVLAEAS